jgi:hypothetical protein
VLSGKTYKRQSTRSRDIPACFDGSAGQNSEKFGPVALYITAVDPDEMAGNTPNGQKVISFVRKFCNFAKKPPNLVPRILEWQPPRWFLIMSIGFGRFITLFCSLKKVSDGMDNPGRL